MTYMLVKEWDNEEWGDETILDRSEDLKYLRNVRVYLEGKDPQGILTFTIYECGKAV